MPGIPRHLIDGRIHEIRTLGDALHMFLKDSTDVPGYAEAAAALRYHLDEIVALQDRLDAAARRPAGDREGGAEFEVVASFLVDAESPEAATALVERELNGRPVQHLIGDIVGTVTTHVAQLRTRRRR